MSFFTENESATVVNERMGPQVPARTQLVMESLVRHLHAFVKDVQLTPDEWELAIDFLTRTGQICSAERQEFILLSDSLGISMLVDAINHQRPVGATENTVFGPFYVEGAPELPMGTNIVLDGKGELCEFKGYVKDLSGQPIQGAKIHVWSDNAEGFYDVQQPELQPKWNNRGVFITESDGAYRFVGIKPVSYPIPDDGPVGDLLKILGRHPYRPAHMHFMIEAPGYNKVITHVFAKGDEYLNSDAVFGVKESLIVEFKPLQESVMDPVSWQAEFDFILVESQ